jgi:cellulose synthase/poly-beta-1,6-N-acetylglucosamine synthase-like glycosyltransferase
LPEPVLLILAGLYLAQFAVLLLGLSRTKDRLESGATPYVSVIVAARNEEQNLPECLASLAAQSYPTDCYEVIVANDGSTDRTAQICERFAAEHPNFRTFCTKEDPTLTGKPNALAQAIELSKGEIILITDADCRVPATWVEFTAKRFSPDVGLVGGMTLQESNTRFGGVQSLDWALILGIASSSTALGNPLGSIGNNLSFRRKAYDEVGGYRNIAFSVTEDYSLVQAIIRTGKWNYLYPIDDRVLVESKPCPTVRAIVQQKHRWGKGGLDMKLWGFVIMAVSFGIHAALVWDFLWFNISSTAVVLLVKMIADYAFLYRILFRLKKTDQLKYFYWFEFYYALYVLVLPFLVFFGGKVDWKGRRYS